MIRAAAEKDISEILNITRACAALMTEKGIYQWYDFYPAREHFQRDLDRGELYVYEQEGKVVGCIVISSYMDEVYKPVKWISSAGPKHLYIHRLAVDPTLQGKQIGVSLMAFAEEFGKKNGFASIRLDTFSQNKRNMAFYKKLQFTQLEEIYFPKQSEFPFYCFEKLLL